MASTPTFAEPVKLVVWDLDETFWQGTLAEEGVAPIPRHAELVKTLAARGIPSSVASKNARDAALAQLEAMDMLDWFVAPAIGFAAKGSGIAALIEALQLRPANVVFLDDNAAVRAEAAFACPGLTCLASPDDLAAALDQPALAGSDDPELTRLVQYRDLASRHDLRNASGQSAEEFLRQSEIRVEIDYEVEPHLERIIELINRSNQLNYTKRRIETDEARSNFVDQLNRYGHKPGIVRVSDKYADYGIVGFFLTLATLREYSLRQFVFSCRILGMGVEQYVYDLLKRPEITVVEPVAHPIVTHERVDWITEGGPKGEVAALRDRKLVLIGGCDMLQLSTYCSMHSTEFTNRDVRGLMKRLDDPFFILEDDADRIRRSEIRKRLPAFDADDLEERDRALADADALVVSFYRMMEYNYFRDRDGLIARFDEDALRKLLSSDQAIWFARTMTFQHFSHDERSDLVRRALWRLAERTPAGCKIIVLTENTRKQEHLPNPLKLRRLYNELVADVCPASDKFVLLDIDQVTSEEWIWDDGFHMHRQGYFELAQAVKAIVCPTPEPHSPTLPARATRLGTRITASVGAKFRFDGMPHQS
jgi:FkbH-like protein